MAECVVFFILKMYLYEFLNSVVNRGALSMHTYKLIRLLLNDVLNHFQTADRYNISNYKWKTFQISCQKHTLVFAISILVFCHILDFPCKLISYNVLYV